MQYYVLFEGQSYGPVDLAGLQQWVNEGRVTLNTEVRDASGTMVPASMVQGLIFPSPTQTQQIPPQQQPYQTNPYSTPPGQSNYLRPQGYSGVAVDTTPTLIKAIVSTLCCGCLPLGVIAIVFAAQAMSANGSGDFMGAEEAKRKSNVISNWSIGFGIVSGILYFVLMVIGAASGNLH